MTNNRYRDIEVVPTGAALGAEIRGIALSQPLLAGQITAVRKALLDHFVLVFRNQDITEEQQVRFTSYFGQAVEHVREQPDRPVKEIFVISNVSEGGKAIGALENRELPFHSDLSYLKKPGTISVLYAIEVPKVGGETQWLNASAAYEALDGETKKRLQGLRAVHRHYREEQNPPEPVDHPIVRVHPESGLKSLYIAPFITSSVVGMSGPEGRRLLDSLIEHMIQPRFIWTHKWQVGDLVIWDNRTTLHRREPFPATERRTLKRTQVLGDEIPSDTHRSLTLQ